MITANIRDNIKKKITDACHDDYENYVTNNFLKHLKILYKCS